MYDKLIKLWASKWFLVGDILISTEEKTGPKCLESHDRIKIKKNAKLDEH